MPVTTKGSIIAQVRGTAEDCDEITNILWEILRIHVRCTPLKEIVDPQGELINFPYIRVELMGVAQAYRRGNATIALDNAGYIPIHKAPELKN